MIHKDRLFPILATGVMCAALSLACTSEETPPPPATQEVATPLPTATAEPVIPTATPPPPSPTAVISIEPFSGQEAYKHVLHLADVVGSRPAGTQEERNASAYIASVLSSYGYTVTQPPFTFHDYQDNGSSLDVTAPSAQNMSANTIYYSPGGNVDGEVFLAGIGRPEDFPTGSLTDKIALVERGTLPFLEKVANAAAAGAVGIIVFNNAPGLFQGTLGDTGAIPAIGIAQEDGETLKALVQQGGLQASLSVDAGAGEIASNNVVAVSGTTCRILVGGHYDSVPAGPGANDNASGIASMLVLARVYKDSAAQLGLCFAAFGGEELGLWGSRKYVENLSKSERQDMKAMLNLDMVGVGDAWRITASEPLAEMLSEIFDDRTGTVSDFAGGRRGRGSDHSSFTRVGIPAVFFYRVDDPNYHSPEDKSQFVDPETLQEAGDMASQLIQRLRE